MVNKVEAVQLWLGRIGTVTQYLQNINIFIYMCIYIYPLSYKAFALGFFQRSSELFVISQECNVKSDM